jgi:hypothetical protein
MPAFFSIGARNFRHVLRRSVQQYVRHFIAVGPDRHHVCGPAEDRVGKFIHLIYLAFAILFAAAIAFDTGEIPDSAFKGNAGPQTNGSFTWIESRVATRPAISRYS